MTVDVLLFCIFPIQQGSGKYSICVWEKSDNKYNLVKQMNSSAGNGKIKPFIYVLIVSFMTLIPN